MPSICISCVVYTLEGRSPEENQYIHMFLLWFSQLIKSGGLQENDIVYIYMDTYTNEYLNNTIFSMLKIIPFKIFIIPQPKTHLEGMMWKYNYNDYSQDIFMYCDIDIYIMKSLHNITNTMKENTIYLCHEGSMEDDNYGADIPNEKVNKKNILGFSAGKFIIYGKEICNNFFNIIHNLCRYDTNYYTVEQPFFNHAILYISNIPNIQVDIQLLKSIVSFNFHNFQKESTVFLDLAGEPGKGPVHLTKMVQFISLLNCNIL